MGNFLNKFIKGVGGGGTEQSGTEKDAESFCTSKRGTNQRTSHAANWKWNN